MEISEAYYTDCGGRDYNEDTCLTEKQPPYYIAVIADGLGGHGGGKEASGTASETILDCFRLTGSITPDLLGQWFQTANENVLERQTKECRMKTTLAVLCINTEKQTAFWSHVGDSRIYHFESGKYLSCTFDHSVSRMAVLAGEISADEIRFHPDRNKLLKAVGMNGEIKAEQGENIVLGNGRHAFLLCTDGFWEYITEEEMEADLKTSKAPEEWLEKMRQRLNCRVHGKNDNHSAIAVFVGTGDK